MRDRTQGQARAAGAGCSSSMGSLRRRQHFAMASCAHPALPREGSGEDCCCVTRLSHAGPPPAAWPCAEDSMCKRQGHFELISTVSITRFSSCFLSHPYGGLDLKLALGWPRKARAFGPKPWTQPSSTSRNAHTHTHSLEALNLQLALDGHPHGLQRPQGQVPWLPRLLRGRQPPEGRALAQPGRTLLRICAR